jgi:hypothetical protein
MNQLTRHIVLVGLMGTGKTTVGEHLARTLGVGFDNRLQDAGAIHHRGVTHRLRLRDQPGLNSEIRMVVSEAEVFLVQEGPVDLDGYLWWRLVGPFDDTRQGWAVSNYLNLVQNP